jgi:hypothetical protein
MLKFCSAIVEPIPYSPKNLTLPEVNGKYAAQNLYCRWTFINNDKDKYISFDYFNYLPV